MVMLKGFCGKYYDVAVAHNNLKEIFKDVERTRTFQHELENLLKKEKIGLE
ncbi:hypothetical protein JFU18_02745 [Bacillus sp. TH22]|uniref:hypothetical protein n=1 Tax=unclassified Bacillus (in: firmicutes) TaxID=185979 RepID=UPI0019129B19|nr:MULTISPECIES: hypothetical protein [unclassified Bacillus (in: firmicutes)]MBK5447603.1 hypothetical protein [Bacillus sp. TH22]MBK5453545.1 hypothetical protein [Bacillus sp. TH23]